MRRILLTICLVIMATSMWASRAYKHPRTVTQPDGTQLTVIAHGDEDLSWYTTTDGVLLVQEGDHFFVAQVAEDGSLLPTAILAHEKDFRQKAEANAVDHQSRELFAGNADKLKRRNLARRIGVGNATPPYFPHTGSPKSMVILIEFQDSTFSVPNPRKTFNDYLNAEGPLTNEGFREDRNYGSVRQYFKDMSNGQFTPQFDIYGPVKLPKKLSYYGNDQGNNKDVNFNAMLKDACTLMDDSLDFSQYDADNDGFVDLLYVIFAGYSQSVGGPSYTIWPKSGTTNFGTFDGKKISRYGLNNELNYTPSYRFSAPPYKRINGIGLFCHEFSHTLGLPDMYATDNSAKIDNQCMEYWDLMDYGEYTDNGYTPTPYTPWEKEVMGWTELQELTEPAIVTLDNQEARKITNSENDEYLILHNVQTTGWASRQLGHGMLVYRIDYNHSNVNITDYPNNTAGKPGITVVAADNLLINGDNKSYTPLEHQQSHAGDPFPGANNVTQLLSVKMNATTIRKPIYDIVEDNGIITFKFLDQNLGTGIEDLILDNTNDTKLPIYGIDGRRMETSPKSLKKGLYIQAGRKFVVK